MRQQHRRDSMDSEDDENDHHPGNYSPTSAMRWDRANDQNQDEDEGPNGANGDHSRRSSLRSSSIIGMDGEETPGPSHTPFPLDAVAGADKGTAGEGTPLIIIQLFCVVSSYYKLNSNIIFI